MAIPEIRGVLNSCRRLQQADKPGAPADSPAEKAPIPPKPADAGFLPHQNPILTSKVSDYFPDHGEAFILDNLLERINSDPLLLELMENIFPEYHPVSMGLVDADSLLMILGKEEISVYELSDLVAIVEGWKKSFSEKDISADIPSYAWVLRGILDLDLTEPALEMCRNIIGKELKYRQSSNVNDTVTRPVGFKDVLAQLNALMTLADLDSKIKEVDPGNSRLHILFPRISDILSLKEDLKGGKLMVVYDPQLKIHSQVYSDKDNVIIFGGLPTSHNELFGFIPESDSRSRIAMILHELAHASQKKGGKIGNNAEWEAEAYATSVFYLVLAYDKDYDLEKNLRLSIRETEHSTAATNRFNAIFGTENLDEYYNKYRLEYGSVYVHALRWAKLLDGYLKTESDEEFSRKSGQWAGNLKNKLSTRSIIAYAGGAVSFPFFDDSSVIMSFGTSEAMGVMMSGLQNKNITMALENLNPKSRFGIMIPKIVQTNNMMIELSARTKDEVFSTLVQEMKGLMALLTELSKNQIPMPLDVIRVYEGLVTCSLIYCVFTATISKEEALIFYNEVLMPFVAYMEGVRSIRSMMIGE